MSSKKHTIRLIALDCDGVLTDGHVWFFENAPQVLKRYSFKDIMGLNLAQRAGFRIAIISGEKIAKALVRKIDIRKIYPDVKHPPIVMEKIRNKQAAIKQAMEKCSVSSRETLYIGDDVNDIAAMETVKTSVAVQDANPMVKRIAKIVTKAKGGKGAVREIVDYLIAKK